MRRAPIVIVATVAGTATVLTFQPRKPEFAAIASAATTPSTGTTGSTGSSSGSSRSSTAGATTSASKTTPTTSASTGTKTATGASIATQYGPVQVKVTVTNGKITDVTPLALTGNDPKSAQISAFAAPTLRQSALTKQTAAIDAVSGATITSAGYEASLQSALDKIGFKAADGSRGSTTVPQVEGHGGPGGFGH